MRPKYHIYHFWPYLVYLEAYRNTKIQTFVFWDPLLTTFYCLAQGMSYDGGDVFTMMIKQDSRDSNVYDAPAYIPDIQVQLLQLISNSKLPRTRESPLTERTAM